MIRKTKWIEDSAFDDQIDVVARRALTGRLDFVWHFLSRAAAADHEAEDVHQLRVATRRAMAALEIFRALLPPRRARKMKKQLKRIRRAAGDARDLDVLAARLKKDQTCHDIDRGTKLQLFVSHLRKQAQPAIENLQAKLSAKNRFVRRGQSLVARLRVRPAGHSTQSYTFTEAAWQGLRPAVDRFFTAAGGDLSQGGALHRLRIRGKRVRYAMEIFVGAFGPEMQEEIYPIVGEIQEKLGKINDHVTAVNLFAGWLDRADDRDVADLLRLLIAEERQAIEQGRCEFLAWWADGRAADLRRRFDDQFVAHQHGQSA